MKYYYATGSNGSVIQSQDGRQADTVSGETTMGMNYQEAFEALNSEADCNRDATWVKSPLLGDFNDDEMLEYVGT